jgi:large subunit ribosomal protein L21
MKYAIVRTGGKQYRVREGQILRVEKLPGDEGAAVEIGDVLLVGEGKTVTIGTPVVPGAKVKAEIVRQGRGRKVMLFKYKPGQRGLKRGHRQPYTQLKITGIEASHGA